MKKIAVLGAGLVGRAMAIDLAKDYDVTSFDFNDDNLNILRTYGIKTIQKDLSVTGTITSICSDYDLILGAVPGFMGFRTVKEAILAGKNVVDISFFPEDCFELDELAKSKNVSVIVDFGVAPGIPNLLAGMHTRKMSVEDYKCYVGGLPVERVYPFQYKAPFSPADVLEEYTRLARYVEHSKIVVKEALTDPELMYFEGVGTLEAFNTDGLRSLIKTLDVPNMIEKTLRYPGHIDIIKILKTAGFLSETEIDINGKTIKPLDFTAKLLFDAWKIKPKENELTVMKIIFEGLEEKKKVKYTYDLLDRYNPETDTYSMARTTGYAATAAVNLMIKGMFSDIGVNPPEYVGKYDACVDFVFDYMKQRGINYRKNKEILD